MTCSRTAEKGGVPEEQVGAVTGRSHAGAELVEKGSVIDCQGADVEVGSTFDDSQDEDPDNKAGISDAEADIIDDKDDFLDNDSPSRRPPLSRSKGPDAMSDSAEESYMYSFRMPHDSVGANKQGTSAVKNEVTPTDYNVVLDNYVEYADDIKIPRLRGKDDDNKLTAAIHSSHWVVVCVVVTASCFLTYSISYHAPFLRADLSQAIVVTLVLATFPEVAASAGAGAFAGMAGLDAVPNYVWLTVLALIVSVIWLFFHHFKVLVGCGGRLGTCAFISMNITVAIFGMPSGAVPWSLYGDASRLWSERLELVPSILTVVACTFLSAVGGAVRLKSKIPLNPVQAPTTIALLCMLILEPTGFQYTGQIDAGLAVGSFVAMASEQYLPSVLDFGAAGFIAGLWILFLDPFFLDFGGKKGFTSFCGFATYVAISKVTFRRAVGEEK